MNSTIEQVIKENKKGIFHIEGVSMLPLIKKGRDTVLIEECNAPLKKNDVVLFKRADNTLILHRIVKIRNSEYVFRGDHQFENEYGITDDMIIGIATGIYRGDLFIPLSSKKQRLYILVRKLTYPFRKVYSSILYRLNIK